MKLDYMHLRICISQTENRKQMNGLNFGRAYKKIMIRMNS